MKAEKIVRQKIRTPDFTPGIKRTETGMHLCVEAPGTFCHLAIYETGKKQGVRIPFSPEERVGDLWMMELAGDDFSGLEYTIETEQGELPDPAIPLPRPSRSVEAMRSAIPEAQAQLAAARTRLDTISGQLQATRDPSELTAQLAEKRRKLESLQSEYEAIQLAMDALSAANQTLQNRFSPALGARTAEIFSALTGGRYDKVLLDRTLALSAEPSGDPTPRSIQVLSQGAADQLYLAVRLAICQLVLPPEKHVPLILDDVFASFDDQRLAAALEWLLQESQNRQILLFTCHDRERTYLAGRPGVHILTLNGGAVCSH